MSVESMFNVSRIMQSLYAYILLFISGFAGVFIGGFLGLKGFNVIGMLSSGSILALILGFSMKGILMVILTLLIFWYLHNRMIGKLSLLSALLIMIIPGLVNGYLTGFINGFGSIVGLIIGFVVFHLIYQYLKKVM